MMLRFFFFFNDTATTEIYTLSLHDALPISGRRWRAGDGGRPAANARTARCPPDPQPAGRGSARCTSAGTPEGRTRCARSEEHTSELQSRQYLVCRLLLEKKNKKNLYLYYSY